jgi:hypothetical protein
MKLGQEALREFLSRPYAERRINDVPEVIGPTVAAGREAPATSRVARCDKADQAAA